MKKEELTGKKIKDTLQAHRVRQRWHNKNKHGGNFGFDIYFAEVFNREKDREITGDYDVEGNIKVLHYGSMHTAGFRLPPSVFETWERFAEFLKRAKDAEEKRLLASSSEVLQ